MMCKLGMCDMRQAQKVFDWVWAQTKLLKRNKLPAPEALGVLPPKAALCTVLFNPYYKVAFVKNTKVGGSSMVSGLGGHCNPDASLQDLAVRP